MNKLSITEEKLLTAQLQLVLKNICSAYGLISLTTLLAFVFLSNERNAFAMTCWLVLTASSSLNLFLFARHYLKQTITQDKVRGIINKLCILYFISGCLWGGLMWITLDLPSFANNLLMITILAGMASGAVSASSPVLPAFTSFIVAEVAMAVSKLWSMNDMTLYALIVGTLFFLAIMFAQARNSARATRSAIELGFKNEELVHQLRQETNKVRAEHEKATQAQHRAELANIAKSRFLAAVSHDLRQPVHAQGLFINVLTQSGLNAKQLEVVDHLRVASDATSEMLHTLMDYSRIEAGAVKVDVTPFRLQPLLNKIEMEFMPQADAKHLSYRSPETVLVARSDQALIEIIMRNLVSNAIRYTETGGILVACRKRGNTAMLEVYDTGIGIAADEQTEIFREFHQLGNPERDRRKGLGLGLSIVSRLAETLGHSLSIKSTPGRGSIFRLILPLADSSDIVPEANSETLPRLKSGIRILLVDDDDPIRVATHQQLLNWDFECDAVESIEAALESAKTAPPDLVISDYRLRKNDTGADVITLLRKEISPSLPALFITGDTDPKRIQEAQAHNIPLLHKPVEASALYRHIVTIMDDKYS